MIFNNFKPSLNYQSTWLLKTFFDSNFDKLCSINPEFVALTKKIIPGDILEECGVGREEEAHDRTVQRVTLIAAVCSSVMAATVLIVTLSSVCRGGKGKDEEYDFPRASYQPVNTNDME